MKNGVLSATTDKRNAVLLKNSNGLEKVLS